MEFINVEEFLKQPKEVQKIFLDWWKPSVGDLFLIERTTSFNGDKHNFIECFLTGFEVTDLTETERKRIICPLLTEGQLRKFIEDKTGFTMSCRFEEYDSPYINDACYIVLYNKKSHKVEHTHEIEVDDLLQAYWKVALKVAKESVENEYK